MAERINISRLTSSDAVLKAIAECDRLGRERFLQQYGFGPAKTLPLRHNGQTYDSKAIAGVAFGFQHGKFPTSENFTGGQSSVARVLNKLGFSVQLLGHPASWLQRGRRYQRKELLDRYGGQLQAGIWTPRNFKVVFMFSGTSGAPFGYSDRWTENGTFEYTGEGQVGDMTFDGGNKAIRDHRKNDVDLFLFHDDGKGKGVRYEGMFECIDWKIRQGTDRNAAPRKIIVFELAPVTSAEEIGPELGHQVGAGKSLSDLRKAAYEAANAVSANSGPKGRTSRNWYERTEQVRAYVLARAAGTCESCEEEAPFLNREGQPYLEPHHTTRRADNGLDHPAHVAAICPDCHRHVHFGLDGFEKNETLKKKIAEKEAQIENNLAQMYGAPAGSPLVVAAP